MKKTLFLLFALPFFTACCDMADEERFDKVDFSEITVQRNVLVEEFTGQDCSNCPDAAQELHNIQKLFGEEHVIAVAIHGGSMAFYPTNRVVGLRTELADEYYNKFNVPDNPRAIIGRRTEPLLSAQWMSAVIKQILTEPAIHLDLRCHLQDGQLQADVHVTGGTKKTKGKLQLWVVEDSIHAIQKFVDHKNNDKVGYDYDYEHNHVLRAAVNGSWGEEISLGKNEQKDILHSIELQEGWNPNHLSVVAFVYDNDGVMDVVKTEVK